MKDQTFAKRFCVLVAGLCLGLLPVQSVWALEITNNGTTIFQDDFENDAVGSHPTISSPDIGNSWHPFFREHTDLESKADVEDDSTSFAGQTDERVGRYLSVTNTPGIVDAEIYATFPNQTSGTLKATFMVNVFENSGVPTADGSAMRIAFSQGLPLVDADEACCEANWRHVAYVAAGSWRHPDYSDGYPVGINDDDVMIVFHDTFGATSIPSFYQPLPIAGGSIGDVNDQLAGLCRGCAGQWIEVAVEQDTAAGSLPVFTLNGVELEPPPAAYATTVAGFDGLEFGSNSNAGTGYIDFWDPNDPENGCITGCAHSPGAAKVYTWTGNIIGDWKVDGNWDALGIPKKTDHTAVLGSNIATPATVVTNSDITVRQIRFDSPVGYVVAGQGSIHLESESVGVDAGIEVLQAATAGVHEFQVRVNLGSDATVNVASEATLNFANVLDLRGGVLTKTGDGTITISNGLILGGGTVSLAQGTLAGNGTIGSDVNNDGGIISPENSVSGASQAVPEPGALGLLLLAGVACFLWRWNQARGPD